MIRFKIEHIECDLVSQGKKVMEQLIQRANKYPEDGNFRYVGSIVHKEEDRDDNVRNVKVFQEHYVVVEPIRLKRVNLTGQLQDQL